jgi:lipoyl(octanoyl) transferase
MFFSESPQPGLALQAYLLGQVDFETILALQRRLVFQVSGDRTRAALILCEHPPAITIGREGSRAHILYEPEELATRRWRLYWVNRGGGCLLHLPGQMAIYPVVPLDRLKLGLGTYLEKLQLAILDVLADFAVPTVTRPGQPGVWVGARAVAQVGVAVRDWVTYYGAALNVHPDLLLLRRVRTGQGEEPMTSLERERRGPLRTAAIRQRFLEYFAARLGFTRTSLLFHNPFPTRPGP